MQHPKDKVNQLHLNHRLDIMIEVWSLLQVTILRERNEKIDYENQLIILLITYLSHDMNLDSNHKLVLSSCSHNRNESRTIKELTLIDLTIKQTSSYKKSKTNSSRQVRLILIIQALWKQEILSLYLQLFLIKRKIYQIRKFSNENFLLGKLEVIQS